VLAHPTIVRAETSERVHAVIAELGYRPNGFARALAGGKSRTVGFVVPTLDNAVFSRALQSMQAVLSGAGYHLLVASSDYTPAAETEAIRALIGQGVDALVVVGADRARETSMLLERAGIPVVVTWVEDHRWPSIIIDNHLAGRLAAQHLLDLGHRRIAVVSLPVLHNDRQRKRVAGVRQALSDAGVRLPDAYVREQSTTVSGGRAAAASLLQLHEPPTAIVCCIDYQAVGAMIEAQASGLDVPEQMSVVGIDNLEFGEHLNPSLTTVQVPTAAIGERAALQIIGRLAKQKMPRVECLSIELIARKSSAPPRPSRSGAD